MNTGMNAGDKQDILDTKSMWRKQANSVIEEAKKKVSIALLISTPEKIDAIFDAISRNCYPWGVRANHPYQIWLSAIKEYRNAAKGIKPTKKAKAKDARQEELF